MKAHEEKSKTDREEKEAELTAEKEKLEKLENEKSS